jgi:hypothetical protein
MLKVLPATITAIVRADTQVVEAQAKAESETAERRVIAYPALTGGLAVGDSVLLNVTATALSLGTGGYDFVAANLSQTRPATFGDPDGSEHIIKLRYTPHQHAVRAVEMMPEYAGIWDRADSLRGTPVVVCELHSQVAAVCAGVKAARPKARVVYVYTDTAALPMAFSRLVPQLKQAGLLDTTITAGQAFGGDYEAVSLPSALIAADWVAGANVIVVGQGPGNAGTGTKYGWSGIEQGSQLLLARTMGGEAIAVLRMSDADQRERHNGISHHSITVLENLRHFTITVALPNDLPGKHYSEWAEVSDILDDHRKAVADSEPGLTLLNARGLRVTTMGRGIEQDRKFFAFATAAGAVAAEQIINR